MKTSELVWPGTVCLAMAALWNETDLTAEEISSHVSKLLDRPVSRSAVLGMVHRMRTKGFVMKRKGPTLAERIKPKTAEKKPEMSFYGWPQKDECSWPIGDPREKDFRFCCAKRGGHDRYCDTHVAVAFRGKDEQR